MASTDIEYATPVAVKMFPAVLHRPDGTIDDGVFVILTARTADRQARMVVYTEEGPGGVVRPSTLLTTDVVAARPIEDSVNSWALTDLDGAVWTIGPGHGCGCHSPLKAFSNGRGPFPVTL